MMYYIIQIVLARTIMIFHTPLADLLPYIEFKVYPSLFKFHTISHHDLQTILVYRWSENELLITTINFRLGLSITSSRSSPSHCTNYHWQGPMLSLPEQDRDSPRSWMAALEAWRLVRTPDSLENYNLSFKKVFKSKNSSPGSTQRPGPITLTLTLITSTDLRPSIPASDSDATAASTQVTAGVSVSF